MRNLGKLQYEILKWMHEHSPLNEWYDGCGWCWDNYSTQVRVLNSLHKRGHVSTSTNARGKTTWTITEQGIKALQEHQK